MALSNEQWNAPSGVDDFYEHQIANSIRVNNSAGDSTATNYLHLNATAGNSDIWTIGMWIKRARFATSNSNTAQAVWGGHSGSGSARGYGMVSDYTGTIGGMSFEDNNGSAWHITTRTNAIYRDLSAWTHVCWRYDSSQGTNTNRARMYVNGIVITDLQVSTYGAQGADHSWNGGGEQFIGTNGTGTDGNNPYQGFDGYIAEVVSIDGTSLDPMDNLVELKNGVLIPKDVSGLTFGDEGFWLQFKASDALGDDTSGNENDFTVVGIAAHDHMLDSPTFTSDSGGNFCTANSEYRGSSTNAALYGALSEGNLKHSFSGSSDGAIPCTHKTPASGKYYFEYAIIAGGGTGDYSPAMGIMDPNVFTFANSSINQAGLICYDNATNKVQKNSNTTGTYSGSRGSNGDVMGIAVDMDNGAFYVSKNGTYQTINGGAVGDPTSGASKTGAGATWTPASEFTNGMVPLSAPNGGNAPIINLNFGQDGTFQGTETAGGNADANDFGNFFTAPPTDYLAVCTGNLTAAADPAEEEQPSKFFQALAYTGNGQNGHDLTTVMKADSVWGKNRTTSAGTATRWFNQTAHNFGTGAEEYVQFDQASYGGTTSQAQGYSGATATNLTVGNNGYTNVNNSSYINYLQGSNGASVVTDTSGDIDVARFATANQGMSVMYYTGTGTSGHTVPHGLGVKPDFVIIKNSTSQNSSAWRVYAKAFGDENDYAVMNTDAAWQSSGGIFTAAPTTSVMALADDVTVNNASNNYMAWAYANAEGMVKAGKYKGNANDDGVFVYTGFRPAMFMCKPILQGNWRMVDTTRSPFNLVANTLFPNRNDPQQTNDSNDLDILSNGVKMRASDSNYNQATTFHYLAFAENPFRFATAR